MSQVKVVKQLIFLEHLQRARPGTKCFNSLNLSSALWLDIISILILRVRKPERHREVKKLAEGHTDG